jgi:GH25 family lysozyme M1 (1,4-beta-N-acetylmuramidase)
MFLAKLKTQYYTYVNNRRSQQAVRAAVYVGVDRYLTQANGKRGEEPLWWKELATARKLAVTLCNGQPYP